MRSKTMRGSWTPHCSAVPLGRLMIRASVFGCHCFWKAATLRFLSARGALVTRLTKVIMSGFVGVEQPEALRQTRMARASVPSAMRT